MSDYMKEVERLLAAVEEKAFQLARGVCSFDESREARADLLAHIQRGVPEGYVAVPRFLAENHRNLTDVPRYQRILDDCLAATPDQFRDATKMMAEPVRVETFDVGFLESLGAEVPAPAEVPMPEPVGWYVSGSDPEHAALWLDRPDDDQMQVMNQQCDDGPVVARPLVLGADAKRYGDAREAAGYARGLADERERCASVAWAHYMDTCRRKGIGPDVLPDWCCAAALRGEVKT